MASALEIRSIPRLWPGSTVVIIGGGPSVNKTDLDLIWKYRTIGVNHAFRLGPVDVLWFVDYKWYETNQQDVDAFAGLKCTCATQLPEMPWPNHIKRVRRAPLIYGIESERADMVCWNSNSGGSAINVAIHLGAKRIALVGFDMRRVAGRTHFHALYPKRTPDRDPFKRHLRCFEAIADEAKNLGVEIVNCTPQSAITQFPFIHLRDL